LSFQIVFFQNSRIINMRVTTKQSSLSYISIVAMGCLLMATISPFGTLSLCRADVVVGGSLTFDLDGAAFANGADVAYINAFGQLFNPAYNYNTSQTFMEFAKHSATAPPGRPLDAPTNFNDLRNTWVRPDSSGLAYGFNSNPSLQTLTFDASNVGSSGATGSTRFTGGDSFWFGNDSLIAPVAGVPASVWLQYGNLSLSFDASRIGARNSGWLFTNNLAGVLPLFDIRNLTVNATAAGPGPGSLVLSGDLFTTSEFRDSFGILGGLDVGNFRFNGVTAVPEPTSLLLVGSIAVCGAWYRNRRIARLGL
jgi:hypothetical protein